MAILAISALAQDYSEASATELEFTPKAMTLVTAVILTLAKALTHIRGRTNMTKEQVLREQTAGSRKNFPA